METVVEQMLLQEFSPSSGVHVLWYEYSTKRAPFHHCTELNLRLEVLRIRYASINDIEDKAYSTIYSFYDPTR